MGMFLIVIGYVLVLWGGLQLLGYIAGYVVGGETSADALSSSSDSGSFLGGSGLSNGIFNGLFSGLWGTSTGGAAGLSEANGFLGTLAWAYDEFVPFSPGWANRWLN